MAGGSIFISYRREDTAGEAGRLADHLTRRFGTGRVFLDIDTIAPGTDFVTALDRALTDTAVVLVVIGRRWLTAATAEGRRRIDDPEDFVRREVATALERGARVIPVLVQDAPMPAADLLPTALAALARRQASAIQHEEFGADAERLADAVAPFVDPPVGAAGARTSKLVAVSAAVAVLVAVVLGGWWWQRSAAAGRAADAAEADRRARQQVVDERVAVATGQFARAQFADALATLDAAVAEGTDTTAATALEEDVAMRWIRELRVGEGETFASALTRPLAVLDRRAPLATGVRRADLLAHLGWATFLRSRDGDARLVPEESYRAALALDPVNPYANVMLGHWTLWRRARPATAVADARMLFRRAADAGRAVDVVRQFQLAALENLRSPEAALESVRVADEMRQRGERLTPRQAQQIWSHYYFALGDRGELTSTALVAVLPPGDHLQTLAWLVDSLGRDDDAIDRQAQYWRARLQAAAGQEDAARDALRALRARLGGDVGTLGDAVTAALAAFEPNQPGPRPRSGGSSSVPRGRD